MTRTQFIAALAEQTGWTKAETKAAIEAFESLVVKSVSSGEPVNLSGFVKFERKDVAAKPRRQVRNPSNGEMVWADKKPASVKVKVTPLKAFKDTVIENKRKGRR